MTRRKRYPPVPNVCQARRADRQAEGGHCLFNGLTWLAYEVLVAHACHRDTATAQQLLLAQDAHPQGRREGGPGLPLHLDPVGRVRAGCMSLAHRECDAPHIANQMDHPHVDASTGQHQCLPHVLARVHHESRARLAGNGPAQALVPRSQRGQVSLDRPPHGRQNLRIALAGNPALPLANRLQGPAVPATEGPFAHRRPKRAVCEGLAAPAPLILRSHMPGQLDQLAHVDVPGYLAKDTLKQGAAAAAGTGDIEDRYGVAWCLRPARRRGCSRRPGGALTVVHVLGVLSWPAVIRMRSSLMPRWRSSSCSGPVSRAAAGFPAASSASCPASTSNSPALATGTHGSKSGA